MNTHPDDHAHPATLLPEEAALSSVSDGASRIYSLMRAAANNDVDGLTFTEIAEIAGRSPRSVRAFIKELRNHGLVRLDGDTLPGCAPTVASGHKRSRE